MDHYLDPLTKYYENGSEYDDGFDLLGPEQSLDLGNFLPLCNVSSEVEFADEQENYPMISYINQILMEENLMEQQPSVDYDPLALQAAEKSFSEVLAKNFDPSSPHQASVDLHSSSSSSSGSSYHYGKNNTTVSPCITDGNVIASLDSESPDFCSANATFSTSQVNILKGSSLLGVRSHDIDVTKKSASKHGGKNESLLDSELISTMFADAETMLQFKKGLEEGSKFLPNGNQGLVDIDKYGVLPSISKDVKLVLKTGKNRRKGVITGSTSRKHQYPENYDDLNPSKHSAVYQEEAVDLSEMFDRVLLYGDTDVLVSSSNGLARGRGKKAGTEAVDLVTLLLSCAQSIAVDDHVTAIEQLKQIRLHASSDGDQYRRLAVIFANALEARLTGSGPDLYAAQISKRVSAAEELKAMRVYLCAPVKQMSSFLANRMIMDAASNSKTLHIVDFGISYGFHWPSFIQLLSKRPGGPPKLRITGIDTPQTGFRPAEKLQDTGRRLAKYSERFHVPFEYKALAVHNWETITLEDLNLSRSEVVAVNCPFALKNLLDETTRNQSPRDAVLTLIREMKPDILTSSVINGPYGSSFFLPRFREALNFFTTIFDCLDNNLPRDDLQRVKFETKFLGLEVLNIVACEGSARVERPETYKQWQARYTRAGFRILALKPEHMKELKRKTKEGYHKDFMLNENDNWMLLGWKGKVISASSCWVPA